MQICRLLRGFTHPGTYFDSSTEEIALFRYVSVLLCVLFLCAASLRTVVIETSVLQLINKLHLCAPPKIFTIFYHISPFFHQCGAVCRGDGYTVGDHAAVQFGGKVEYGAV